MPLLRKIVVDVLDGVTAVVYRGSVGSTVVSGYLWCGHPVVAAVHLVLHFVVAAVYGGVTRLSIVLFSEDLDAESLIQAVVVVHHLI